MIYLDHAATSWPKPPEVIAAMTGFLQQAGGNPGRSGHRMSVQAGRIVYEARESLAELLGVRDPLRVILTQNGTYALNIALFGLLRPGDAVVTSSMEHNSVMRPLRALQSQGVEVRLVPCSRSGELDVESYKSALAAGARLVVITHASNVIGRVMPIDELASIAHEHGTPVLVDAAQTAGVFPLNVQAAKIDLLAFTGHKGLQGPPGTGGLVIGENVDPAQIKPLAAGGTGSTSSSEEQPGMLPDKFEAGTPNGAGIAGLGEAVRSLLRSGIDKIRSHHARLMDYLVGGLSSTPRVTVYGPPAGVERAPLVSFTVEGRSNSELGLRLDTEFDVLCRVGLHCAPAAHRTIGTFPDGALRFSIGPNTTEGDISQALDAVAAVARP